MCRSDDFRVAFSNIGDLHRILPNEVRILALTATATLDIFKAVKTRLSLDDPVLVGVTPNSLGNIKYHIEPMLSDLMSADICRLRTSFPKTLIFC